MGLRAGKLDRRRGVNEDREQLEISGDRDWEPCAGNKHGGIDGYLQREGEKCGTAHVGYKAEEFETSQKIRKERN